MQLLIHVTLISQASVLPCYQYQYHVTDWVYTAEFMHSTRYFIF